MYYEKINDFRRIVATLRKYLPQVRGDNLEILRSPILKAIAQFESRHGGLEGNYNSLYREDGYFWLCRLKSHFPMRVRVGGGDTAGNKIDPPRFLPDCPHTEAIAEKFGWEKWEKLDVRLGSYQLSPEIYVEFATKKLGLVGEYGELPRITRTHHNGTISWSVEFDKEFCALTYEFGSKRSATVRSFYEKLLNRSVPTYEVYHEKSPRLNHRETAAANTAAQAKADEINEMFERWLWAEPIQAEEIAAQINDRLEPYEITSGEELDFPGSNPEIDLRPHQRNLAARIVESSVIGSHGVGTGKTFSAIAGIMESRRLGTARKVVFAALNKTQKQIASEFNRLYPLANVVCPRNLKSSVRREVLEELAANDFDVLILTHSQLHLCIQEGLLGWVDLLIVDEVHKLKNMPFESRQKNVKSIPLVPRKDGQNARFLEFVDSLRERNGRFVGLTGTLLSNSIAEIYLWQRLVQPEVLKRYGVSSFDEWRSVFTVPSVEQEFGTSGKLQPAVRFKEFLNLDLLFFLLGKNFDFVNRHDLDLDVPEMVQIDETIAPSPAHEYLLRYFKMRCDRVERGEPLEFKRANGDLLPDAKHLIFMEKDASSLSPKLSKHVPAGESPQTKLSRCAWNVYQIWKATEPVRGAQIIFCDRAVPAPGREWDAYNHLRDLLIALGIPPEEVAIVGSDKSEVVAGLNSGRIRVAIGSTHKLGTGTDAHLWGLWAIHNVDIPWSLDGIEQRIGRVIRQRNGANNIPLRKAWVFNYCLKRFDMARYQTVEAKLQLLQSFLSGTASGKSEDIDLLSVSGLAAELSGNPHLPAIASLKKQIAKLKARKAAIAKKKREAPQEIRRLERSIRVWERECAIVEGDISAPFDPKFFTAAHYKKYQQIKREKPQVLAKVGRFAICSDRTLRSGFDGQKSDLVYEIMPLFALGYDQAISALKKWRQSLPKKVESYRKDIEKASRNLLRLRDSLEEEFEGESELLLLSEELRQLEIDANEALEAEEAGEVEAIGGFEDVPVGAIASELARSGRSRWLGEIEEEVEKMC